VLRAVVLKIQMFVDVAGVRHADVLKDHMTVKVKSTVTLQNIRSCDPNDKE